MTEPYYAVIFNSQRTEGNEAGYEDVSAQMAALAKSQGGFIGMDSVRDAEGKGITISYWKSLADIKAWKTNADHLQAQRAGRREFYSDFQVKICKVEREY